jgi:hypothetical protein
MKCFSEQLVERVENWIESLGVWSLEDVIAYEDRITTNEAA